jgi:hypothetical protein
MKYFVGESGAVRKRWADLGDNLHEYPGKGNTALRIMTNRGVM